MYAVRKMICVYYFSESDSAHAQPISFITFCLASIYLFMLNFETRFTAAVYTQNFTGILKISAIKMKKKKNKKTRKNKAAI